MRASITSAIAFCALGFALTAPANATARVSPTRDDETVRTTVHYGDLNLQTHAGASALYTRLSEAATRVCGDLMEPYARMTREYHKCHSDALAAAVHDVNRPLVTQTYIEHSKRA
jgi:UrcA family protein